MKIRNAVTVLTLPLIFSGCAGNGGFDPSGTWTGDLERSLCGETHGTKPSVTLKIGEVEPLGLKDQVTGFFGKTRSRVVSGEMFVNGVIDPADKDALNQAINYEGKFAGMMKPDGEISGRFTPHETHKLQKVTRFKKVEGSQALDAVMEQTSREHKAQTETVWTTGNTLTDAHVPEFSIHVDMVPKGKDLKAELTQQHPYCQNFDAKGETLLGVLHR